MKKKVQELKKQVADADKKIMKLVKKRIEATRLLGQIEVKKSISIADKKYEKVIGNGRKTLAKALDVEVDFVDKLFKHIIDYSNKAKNKLK